MKSLIQPNKVDVDETPSHIVPIEGIILLGNQPRVFGVACIDSLTASKGIESCMTGVVTSRSCGVEHNRTSSSDGPKLRIPCRKVALIPRKIFEDVKIFSSKWSTFLRSSTLEEIVEIFILPGTSIEILSISAKTLAETYFALTEVDLRPRPVSSKVVRCGRQEVNSSSSIRNPPLSIGTSEPSNSDNGSEPVPEGSKSNMDFELPGVLAVCQAPKVFVNKITLAKSKLNGLGNAMYVLEGHWGIEDHWPEAEFFCSSNPFLVVFDESVDQVSAQVMQLRHTVIVLAQIRVEGQQPKLKRLGVHRVLRWLVRRRRGRRTHILSKRNVPGEFVSVAISGRFDVREGIFQHAHPISDSIFEDEFIGVLEWKVLVDEFLVPR